MERERYRAPARSLPKKNIYGKRARGGFAMPLVRGASDAAVHANIRREIEAGRPRDQAVAIALDVARRSAGRVKRRERPKYRSTGLRRAY